MKNKVLKSIAGAGLALTLGFALFPNQIQAKDEEPPCPCYVEVIDCPGWGTGDRQVCHQNGSGLACSCGASTICM